MPTGYTHKVQTGEMVTLKEYALTCARAFVACVEMRDSSIDVPIPEEFKISKWFQDCLESAQDDLAIALSWTLKDAEKECQKEYEFAMAHHKEYLADKEKERQNYQNMIDKVLQWKYPPELQGLKDFMLSQLRDSIKYDCSTDYITKPVKQDAYEWLKSKKEYAEEKVKTAQDRIANEQLKLDSNNKWLKSLRDSLKTA